MVLAIAGGTCSGKSTFARHVADTLSESAPAKVIGLDTFYTRDTVNGPTLTLSDGTHMFDFNHPDAINTAAVIEAVRLSQERWILLEGLFALAIPELRELIDGPKVFVRLDADLRALRRLLRDMKGGRMSTDPEFIARYYIESARVGHARYVEPSRRHADLEVIGDAEGMGEGLNRLIGPLLASS